MTKKGKISLTIFILGLFAFLLTWIFYQRRQDIALANKLVAEFHRHYNSDEFDPDLEYSPMIRNKVADTRDELGRLLNVKQCDIWRSRDLPSLDAKCLSTFQGGEAVEFFMFQAAAGDQHPLGYLVVYLAEKPQPAAARPKRWADVSRPPELNNGYGKQKRFAFGVVGT